MVLLAVTGKSIGAVFCIEFMSALFVNHLQRLGRLGVFGNVGEALFMSL